MVFSAAILGAVAGAGQYFQWPNLLGADKANWFWLGLAGLGGIFVLLPLFLWLLNPRKCSIETADDLLTIRTGNFGKRKLELSKIEKIFVEDNLATIFYRTKRGFPTSWMIEKNRFKDECWEKLKEALNAVKTQLHS